MNKHKLAFIICTNDRLYCDECLHYISYLKIPEGFEIEIITIEDADYMTKAYNSAMKASDAKYKVYLHQDVFIVNKNFIYDILKIFEDPVIGMIGMVGTKIAMNFYGIDNCNWTKGMLYTDMGHRTYQDVMGSIMGDYEKVQIIDGMIMITQYDLSWREDKFTGWHFYDHSQCMEFLENGFDIVVPNQKTPWVMHDHGIINRHLYDEWGTVFLKEYADFLGKLKAGVIGKIGKNKI